MKRITHLSIVYCTICGILLLLNTGFAQNKTQQYKPLLQKKVAKSTFIVANPIPAKKVATGIVKKAPVRKKGNKKRLVKTNIATPHILLPIEEKKKVKNDEDVDVDF